MISFVPLVLAAVASAKIYTSPSQLPSGEFDYIIIGGGTAGNTIAMRLSEYSSEEILVLESGPSYENELAIQIPLLGATLVGGPFDWGYKTTPQKSLNNAQVTYPRGKVLGGSSAINFMAYNHPTSDDWNRWANVVGEPNWSWNQIQPYITNHEAFMAKPADSGRFTPTAHGYNGPVKTSLRAHPLGIDTVVFDAFGELRSEFPFNEDINSGKSLGVGWMQSTIANGERQHSGNSYLAPQYISRPNLHVLVGAHVNTIAQSTKVNPPRFNVVNYVISGSSTVLQAKARKEIIVSAGSIGTPKLLLLSGIGPKADLDALKIPVVIDNKNVGAGLEDHPYISLFYKLNETLGNDEVLVNPTAALMTWFATKSGPLANSMNNQIGFFRLPKDAPVFKTTPDPAPGPAAPHYELLVGSGYLSTPQPTTGAFMTLSISFLTPVARGSIKLASADPEAAPLINPDIMGHPFDIYAMKEGVKKAHRLSQASAFKARVLGPAGPFVGAMDSDASIEAYVRANTITTSHPSSSAAMSARGSETGVVDPDFKVKGAAGLRVVDASAFPFVPSSHPQGAVYIMAERAADYIKADWSKFL